MHTSPPTVAGRCDRCGTALTQRGDDDEQTIAERLRGFEAQTKPLIAFYRAQGKLSVVGEFP